MAGRRSPPAPQLRRRGRPVIEPRLRITIFCEGANTEPQYFSAFAAFHGNGLVILEAVGGVGVPETIMNMAVERVRSRVKKEAFGSNDQTWAAFDCDTHPNVTEQIRRGRTAGVRVAYSNPCMELWALLHFGEFDAPNTSAQVQKALAKKMPTFDRKHSKIFDFELMREGYEDACRRSARMCKRREEEGDPYGNPWTNVHELTERIVENGLKWKQNLGQGLKARS